MDDTIVAGNINGEVREGTEGLLAKDGVIDEVLAEFPGIGEGLASLVGEVSGANGRRSDLRAEDGVLEDVRGDGAGVLLERLDGGVGGSKDSERAGSGKLGGNTGGLKAVEVEIEVIEFLEVGPFNIRNEST